jgi:predicted MFS family arabinose efflux permease
MLVITFGIIGGAGIGTANVSTVPPAVKWFPPSKKGLVTGVSVAGIGISAVVYSPLANGLLHSVGISKTFVYIGIAALVLMVLLSQFLTNPPAGYVAVSSGSLAKQTQKSAATTAKDLGLKEVLKTSSFYRLWIMFCFSASAGLMIIAHASPIAKVQIQWEGGFYLVILLAVFNAAGRILGGAVSDKIGRMNLMRIIFALQAVNMLLFTFYGSIILLAVGIAVTGLCYGAGFSVFPAMAMDLYGMKNFGVNYGLVMTGWGFGGVIGPMMAAAIVDASKNYDLAYVVAGILLVVTFLITFTFRRKKVAIS